MLNFIRGVCKNLGTALGFTPIEILIPMTCIQVNSEIPPATQFLHKPVSQVYKWDYG